MFVTNGPDFICVGMPKSGTDWLFDQLQFHPDFWMPPLKEMHYLDRDVLRAGNAKKWIALRDQEPRRFTKKLSRRRSWDKRDFAFLDEMIGRVGDPLDLTSYASLFRFKDGLLAGDITPHYAAMSDESVARVGRHLPETRVLMMLRDPVARAWSHICMWHRAEHFNELLLSAPAKFRAYLEHPEKGRSILLRSVSFPSQVAWRWETHAPQTKCDHVFLDDIAAQPEQARAKILTFLGADPAKPSGRLAADHNPKSSAPKLPLTDDILAVLVDFFRDELRACAARFEGHARSWAARYGV